MAIFALGSSLFTRCYEFCNSVSIKCRLNLKTHWPHTSHSHSTLEEVCSWVKTGESDLEARPPKLNVGHTEDGYNQGGLSLCVCEGVYIFFLVNFIMNIFVLFCYTFNCRKLENKRKTKEWSWFLRFEIWIKTVWGRIPSFNRTVHVLIFCEVCYPWLSVCVREKAWRLCLRIF